MKRSFALTAGLLAALFALPASADNYTVDNDHSTVLFATKHFGVSLLYGRFRKVSGTVNVDKKASKSSVKIEIDAASVYTANKKRDQHLKGPDFLNVKQFPKITFVSTKVRKSGKGVKVTGNLTLHGVTKSVTVKLDKIGEGKDAWGKYRTGYHGTFKIDRHAYGISKMKGAVGDKITLTVAIEGIRQ